MVQAGASATSGTGTVVLECRLFLKGVMGGESGKGGGRFAVDTTDSKTGDVSRK